MTRFKQRTGKMNFKGLVKTNTTVISNLLFSGECSDNPRLENIIRRYSRLDFCMHEHFPGIVYGKPNSILKELENSPGVWVFDFENGVTILMFSDGFRKNNYKGTSYELEIKDNFNKDDVADALESLLDDFQSRFQDQLPTEYIEYKEFHEKFFKLQNENKKENTNE